MESWIAPGAQMPVCRPLPAEALGNPLEQHEAPALHADEKDHDHKSAHQGQSRGGDEGRLRMQDDQDGETQGREGELPQELHRGIDHGGGGRQLAREAGQARRPAAHDQAAQLRQGQDFRTRFAHQPPPDEGPGPAALRRRDQHEPGDAAEKEDRQMQENDDEEAGPADGEKRFGDRRHAVMGDQQRARQKPQEQCQYPRELHGPNVRRLRRCASASGRSDAPAGSGEAQGGAAAGGDRSRRGADRSPPGRHPSAWRHPHRHRSTGCR